MIYELKGKYSNVNAIKINAIIKTVFKTIKSYTEKSSFKIVYCIIFKYGTILICVADLKSVPPNLFLLENIYVKILCSFEQKEWKFPWQ